MKRSFAYALLIFAVAAIATPAHAASPNSGTLSKSHRSLTWNGPTFLLSDPFPDPVLGLDMSCTDDSACDHFALKANLGNNARIQISITTARPNPPGTVAGVASLQPITGDDYDLYVYDPDGALISGTSGTSERGNETVTITHRKRFNGRAYDVAVRPWAVAPGSTYTGSIKALTLGR